MEIENIKTSAPSRQAKNLKDILENLQEGAPSLEEKPLKRLRKKPEEATQVIEATLLELMNCGASDSARVSAAKALMDLVKYMNGEKDQSAKKHEEAEKVAAIAQARTLLAEFTELKFKLGSVASAPSVGVEQPHEVVDKRKTKPDNAAVG